MAFVHEGNKVLLHGNFPQQSRLFLCRLSAQHTKENLLVRCHGYPSARFISDTSEHVFVFFLDVMPSSLLSR